MSHKSVSNQTIEPADFKKYIKYINQLIYFKQFLHVFIRLLEKSKIFAGKNANHLKIVKKSNRKLFRAEKLL